ncbi:nitroreductase, partial [Clostridioides difficile]|nr:nitroreductase [Clostridioides difficile]HBN6210140.1 nitroreductase [Clostridioides difficile]
MDKNFKNIYIFKIKSSRNFKCKWMQDLCKYTQNLSLKTTNQFLAAFLALVFSNNKVTNKVRQFLDLTLKLIPYALVSTEYSEEK